MINGTNESDSEVLWTWKRLMEKTEPYCRRYRYYNVARQEYMEIWRLSPLALREIADYYSMQ